MSELTQADQYLLDEIRRGSADGWAQLVARYQGRLVAYARGKVPDASEAEDLAQETFIALLRSLAAFRGDASLETYLFTILRRKIVDWFRGRRSNVCRLQDLVSSHAEGTRAELPLPSDDPTASQYMRRQELTDLQRTALLAAVRALLGKYKKAGNLRDLRAAELLFYCQLRNKDAAEVLGLDEKHVALIKHRAIKQIRETVAKHLPDADALFGPEDESLRTQPDQADAMLSQLWQHHRLSCPKRSTIGAFLLGTLEPDWATYVDFHLNQLGCEFCMANLDDLKREQAGAEAGAVRQRILESTVGFLSRPSR